MPKSVIALETLCGAGHDEIALYPSGEAVYIDDSCPDSPIVTCTNGDTVTVQVLNAYEQCWEVLGKVEVKDGKGLILPLD